MSFTITNSNLKGVNPHFANQLPTSTPAFETSKQLNPNLEGTSAAFGGTAGLNLNKSMPSYSLPSALETITDNTVAVTLPNKKTSVNILNNDTDISYSDYSAFVSANAQNKLQDLTGQANNALLQEANAKRFFNLSLGEIIDRTVLTVIAIFSESLNLLKSIKTMSLGQIIYEAAQIFLQKDRVIYVGVFLVFMSILFMTIFLSS